MSDAPSSLIHDRQRQILGELAEIGLDVARAVGRQAQAHGAAADAPVDPAPGPAPAPVDALALAYARVSRAVRLTLMLQSQLIEDEAAQARAEAKATANAAPPTAEDIKKARIERIVERLVTAEHRHDVDLADELTAEAAERLDDEDVYGDLMRRPISEIVARLCRDLDLSPDWTRLAQELWAKAEIASGDVGAPLARLPLPLDGVLEIACDFDGQARSGGDGPAAARPTGRPHPRPFPHQGGREPPSPPGPSSCIPAPVPGGFRCAAPLS